MNSQAVQIETNSLNFPISCACQDLLDKQNSVNNVEVTFLYDLAFPGIFDEDIVRERLESNLMQQLAISYGLWDGTACELAPTEGLWVLKASSDPQDARNPLFDSCYELVPNSTENCVTYNGAMTVTVVGPDDVADIIEHISNLMSNGAVTADTDLRAVFLGTQIDVESYSGGRNNLAPAINNVELAPVGNDNVKDRTWTPIGVLLVLGICLAVVGVVSTLIVKRRRNLREKELKAKEVVEFPDNDDDSDAILKNRRDGTPQTCLSPASPNNDWISELQQDDEVPSFYTVDMGHSMKSELFGVHGLIGVTTSPGFRMRSDSEYTESDADSWAQADATLGALETAIDGALDAVSRASRHLVTGEI